LILFAVRAELGPVPRHGSEQVEFPLSTSVNAAIAVIVSVVDQTQVIVSCSHGSVRSTSDLTCATFADSGGEVVVD
jgi:hypothetical protein